MSRRLNFLFYILHENSDALIRNVFDEQRRNPAKGDWVLSVLDDLEKLNIDKTFDDIELMEKESFKTLVREAVKQKAFEYLTQTQAAKSKGKEITYNDISLQPYLKPNKYLSIKEKAFIFSARTRMLELKCNYKSNQTSLSCRKCNDKDEDQKHLLDCPELDQTTLSLRNTPCYEDLFTGNVENLSVIGLTLMSRYQLFRATNAQWGSQIVRTH